MPFIPNPNNPDGPQIEVTQAEYDAWVVDLSSKNVPVDPNTDPEVPSAPATDPVPLDQIEKTPPPVVPQEAFPVAYDDEGNLLPGYQLTENNDPVFVGAGTTATVYGPAPVAPAGVAYDDEGNLLPGYALNPAGAPVFVGSNYVAPATQAQADADRVAALKVRAQQQQSISSQRKQVNNGDWRVRLRLAPQSKYLYNAPQPGILQPLTVTDGIIFPYTPKIDSVYRANYESYDLTHSNYRGYFYKNSAVEAITLTATFTAQDTSEANYLLAVITFLKSATKMFYGQDAERGAPPPVVYLTGLGEYQFNEHSCLIQSFNYNLPGDVDYIRAGSPNNIGTDLTTRRDRQNVATNGIFGSLNRLASAFLTKGAIPNIIAPTTLQTSSPTYVPTKMDITISLLPVQSRQQVSQQFSLKNFANGNLIKGGFW
jgi:hypothetical protein